MKEIKKMTVGEIVAEDYRASQVFRAAGLDFCCGGGKTLEEACRLKKIDSNKVITEIFLLRKTVSDEQNYNDWKLDFLIDYIIQNHHSFVRRMLPEVVFYAEKVANRHGQNHPELFEILRVVRQLAPELLEHLEKEENDTFPSIKELVNNIGNVKSEKAMFNLLEEEHENAGEMMAIIEELSNGFTPPDGACASYQLLFKNLEAFKSDLHKHVHLENNILFPKALSLVNRVN
tara:strand:- start:6964 stop:7659 length:696 start_codon:yes stop_codon:yes gene_type:complete